MEDSGANNYPLGIQFWAEHYQNEKPPFRVFKCVGTIEGTGSYIFESMDAPVSLRVKRWDELNSKDFRPFLLPLDKIRKKYGEEY